MTDDSRPAIRDNVAAHRFEMIVDRHAAVATYVTDACMRQHAETHDLLADSTRFD